MPNEIPPPLERPKQSTTGPEPPPEVESKSPTFFGEWLADGTDLTVNGVPGYLWRHGCGPTSVGMVIGHHDNLSFDDLFEGDATSQTEAVNQGIASQEDQQDPKHYEDYSQTIDSGESSPLPDKSEPPQGDEHTSDCIADFMQTSWSAVDNFYGWSWSSDIHPSFNNYVELRNSTYSHSVNFYKMGSTLNWEVLTNEIDHNRPMVFLVDSNGDGWTDHFVTVVGYRTEELGSNTLYYYGCLDTWDPPGVVRWAQFREVGCTLIRSSPTPVPSQS